ncbi:MAG TPA: polymer-forming cytoskeletal protein [Methyloceanibacter sp.]|nr:polymer-forming cytoskeletal protein [Methyloceanibacter sp.]
MSDTFRDVDASQASRKLGDSTIGEDLKITGNVSSKGEIHVDGEVKGDVSCVALVLGESGRLEGNVIAEDVVIRGRLIGSIRALRVTLQAMCHVEGDVYHQSIALEQGAFFEGRSSRSHADRSCCQRRGKQAVGRARIRRPAQRQANVQIQSLAAGVAQRLSHVSSGG